MSYFKSKKSPLSLLLLWSSSSSSSSSGSKGWRSGESTCLPPMWPGFKSRHRCHMWVEFVVGSLLCSERFSSSTRNQVDEEPLCGCATSKSLFIIIHHHHYCSHHQIWATYLQMLPRLLLHLQWLLSFACFLAFLQKLSKDKKKTLLDV